MSCYTPVCREPEKTNAPEATGAFENSEETTSTVESVVVAQKIGNPGYFQTVGQSLIDNGYLIIPIKPGHKRPALDNWQTARLGAADLSRYASHGVGVLCGQGAQPIAAIDIDTTDEFLASRFTAWCQEHLGLTAERVGNAPKILLAYRAEQEGWGKATGAWFEDLAGDKHRLEVLGKGQQFVAYHIHPDTGRPYEWVDLFGGLDAMHASDLPVITEAQVEEALHVFEVMAEEAGLVRVSGSKAKAGGLTSAPSDDPLMAYTPPVGISLTEANHRIANIDREDYDTWLKVGMSLHHEFDGDVAALDLWDEWSSTAANYAARDDLEKRWDSFGRSGRQPVSFRSIFKIEREAKKPDHRADNLDAARREHQKKENERIGNGSSRYPTVEVIDLKGALTRFVFMSDGSRVADIFNPHYDLAFSDWYATFAASKETIWDEEKRKEKQVAVPLLWRASKERKTVVCRTFKAGGAPVLNDPNGKLALNTWRPFDRTTDVQDVEAAGLSLFLDHIDLLFGKDASRFLDWLAHIEQRPGELPHTAWLHIAKHFGLGRNWMESVLARVWAGAVAANLDLVSVLKKDGYNGRLSCKVLAVVDEIREGGRDTQWEHSEKMKSIITEETRQINPKYGRQSVEFNACRWLMFSNHLSAIPLEDGDRRIEVVYTEARPLGADYYARLYAVLDDALFIASVAKFLGERDIRTFNPGAHAVNSDSKKAATKASQTPMAAWCETLVDHWPSDLVMSQHLFDILVDRSTLAREGSGGSLNAAHRRTLEQYGVEALGKPLKVEGRPVRVSIVRNKERWKQATPDSLRSELAKVTPGLDSARDYLMELAACE